MTFSERLEFLLEEKEISWAVASKHLNIGKNQKKYWDEHGSVPDGRTLIKLAEYLDVTSDYLLGIDARRKIIVAIVDDRELSDREINLIRHFRELDLDGKAHVESKAAEEHNRIKIAGDSSITKEQA